MEEKHVNGGKGSEGWKSVSEELVSLQRASVIANEVRQKKALCRQHKSFDVKGSAENNQNCLDKYVKVIFVLSKKS